MKKLLVGISVLAMTLISSPAFSLTRQQVSDLTLTSRTERINLSNGHSVTLSMDNGKFIQSVWIDDPSLLGVASDRPFCDANANANNCGNIRLLRLVSLSGALNLPGLNYQTDNGRATLMTIIATDANGGDSEAYQFEIVMAGSSGGVSRVSIVPEQVKVPSRAAARIRPAFSGDIVAVELGMQQVMAEGRARTDSVHWENLQEFIETVNDGEAIGDAITQTGVSRELLAELESIGKSQISESSYAI